MAETLNINTEGNPITLDVGTVQLNIPAESVPDFAANLGAEEAIGAGITQLLLGGRQEGKTGVNLPGGEKGRIGTFSKTALDSLVTPLVSSLQTNFNTFFATLNSQITEGRFGAGFAGLTEGLQPARAQLAAQTGIDFTAFVKPDDVTKFSNTLRALGGNFAPLVELSKENETGFKKLAGAFAVLETQIGTETLTRQLKVLANQQGATIETVTNGLIEFGRTSGSFAKVFGTSLGVAGDGIDKFRSKVSFAANTGLEEAAKLAAVSRKLGLDTISDIFTKRLITFEEAANFGADLGVLLGGINIDLNEFVNALPSERVQMGFTEIADAIDEGRLRISEDGAKFGQQAALFAQQFDIDEQTAERLLRRGREGGQGIRDALAEGLLGSGAQLNNEDFINNLSAQRTSEQAQQQAFNQVTTGRADEVSQIGVSVVNTLDRLTTVIEEEGLLNQLSPFVLAIQELTEIARPFGVETGAAGGLGRAAFIGGGATINLLGETFEKLEPAAAKLQQSIIALSERTAAITKNISTGGDKLIAPSATDVKQISQTIAPAMASAFRDPQVVTAIGDAIKGRAREGASEAFNGTNILGVGKR